MDCKIFETPMCWKEIALFIPIFMFATWKIFELITAAEKWAEKKCDAERKARYAALENDLEGK